MQTPKHCAQNIFARNANPQTFIHLLFHQYCTFRHCKIHLF